MAHDPYIEDEPLANEQLTKIVSYLDGELDDTQMNEVEQSLINDPDMRSHADILSRTWALLDSLEEVSASSQFTEQTLATISAIEASDDDTKDASSFGRLVRTFTRYKIIPCFLAGLIGGTVGLLISARMTAKQQQSGERAATRIILENFDLLQDSGRILVVPPDLQSLKDLQLPRDDASGRIEAKGDSQ